MQAGAVHIKDVGYNEEVRREFARWYANMYDSIFSLLAAILGGADWIDIVNPLVKVSEFYRIAFAFYIVFVVVGVLNVLTGVFLDSAKDFKDRDLIVQQEINRMDNFVSEMLELFHEFDPHHTGKISYEDFSSYICEERVQPYLTSHTLDTTHADMLYHLLDPEKLGSIDIHDFIHGLLRLKGTAKELDSRVMLHELRKLRMDMEDAAVIAKRVKLPLIKQADAAPSESGNT
jgi:hypothetical protein